MKRPTAFQAVKQSWPRHEALTEIAGIGVWTRLNVLVADVWSWSGGALVGTLTAISVAYVGAAMAYRGCAVDTAPTPVVRRVDRLSAVGSEGTDRAGS